MVKYLNKKIKRLLVSKNVMKIIYFFHYITGGINSKKIDIDFEGKESRIKIVQEIINLKNYRSYLEIGTFEDELFSKINCQKKIGVDPHSGGNMRMTSDDFFTKNEGKFDFIFIDGLHHYSQVKRDINNSLKILNEGGAILIHDCLPRNYYYQAVPRSQLNWNGDTWKAFLETRSDEKFDTYCINADEGLGVILKRKNRNLIKFNIKDFKKFKFNDYVENYKNYLNLIEYRQFIGILKEYE